MYIDINDWGAIVNVEATNEEDGDNLITIEFDNTDVMVYGYQNDRKRFMKDLTMIQEKLSKRL